MHLLWQSLIPATIQSLWLPLIWLIKHTRSPRTSSATKFQVLWLIQLGVVSHTHTLSLIPKQTRLSASMIWLRLLSSSNLTTSRFLVQCQQITQSQLQLLLVKTRSFRAKQASSWAYLTHASIQCMCRFQQNRCQSVSPTPYTTWDTISLTAPLQSSRILLPINCAEIWLTRRLLSELPSTWLLTQWLTTPQLALSQCTQKTSVC